MRRSSGSTFSMNEMSWLWPRSPHPDHHLQNVTSTPTGTCIRPGCHGQRPYRPMCPPVTQSGVGTAGTVERPRAVVLPNHNNDTGPVTCTNSGQLENGCNASNPVISPQDDGHCGISEIQDCCSQNYAESTTQGRLATNNSVTAPGLLEQHTNECSDAQLQSTATVPIKQEVESNIPSARKRNKWLSLDVIVINDSDDEEGEDTTSTDLPSMQEEPAVRDEENQRSPPHLSPERPVEATRASKESQTRDITESGTSSKELSSWEEAEEIVDSWDLPPWSLSSDFTNEGSLDKSATQDMSSSQDRPNIQPTCSQDTPTGISQDTSHCALDKNIEGTCLQDRPSRPTHSSSSLQDRPKGHSRSVARRSRGRPLQGFSDRNIHHIDDSHSASQTSGVLPVAKRGRSVARRSRGRPLQGFSDRNIHHIDDSHSASQTSGVLPVAKRGRPIARRSRGRPLQGCSNRNVCHSHNDHLANQSSEVLPAAKRGEDTQARPRGRWPRGRTLTRGAFAQNRDQCASPVKQAVHTVAPIDALKKVQDVLTTKGTIDLRLIREKVYRPCKFAGTRFCHLMYDHDQKVAINCCCSQPKVKLFPLHVELNNFFEEEFQNPADEGMTDNSGQDKEADCNKEENGDEIYINEVDVLSEAVWNSEEMGEGNAHHEPEAEEPLTGKDVGAWCELCRKRFENKAILLQHIQTLHQKQKTTRCIYCKVVHAEIDTHILRAHKDVKACITCRKFFTLTQDAQHDCRPWKPRKERRKTKDTGSRGSKKIDSVKRLVGHHRRNEPATKVVAAGRRKGRPIKDACSTVTRFLTNKYMCEDMRTCKKCDYRSESYTNLLRHVWIHTRVSRERPKESLVKDGTTCKLCGFSDKNKNAVLHHISTHVVSTSALSKRCEYCNALCERARSLACHMKHSHKSVIT